jgi:hypothetical protein
MQRAIVTPIATETGVSVPSGTSDSENDTRNRRNRNNNSSSNTIWKNRRPHNPSSIPIPLLDATPPRRKGHRRREDPLQQPSFKTKTSAEASSSLVSPRTLVAMFVIMVVCVVLEVILIDSFFFDGSNYTLRANGRKTLLHALIPSNKSHSMKTVLPKKYEADAVSVSVITPPSIAATATDTSTSTTNGNLRTQHVHRRPVLIDDNITGFTT